MVKFANDPPKKSKAAWARDLGICGFIVVGIAAIAIPNLIEARKHG